MRTALAMCEQMQNAAIAYTQSDEISILLRDWDRLETQQWFGGNLQKIVSMSGAMATAYFNYFLSRHFYEESNNVVPQSISAVPLFDARAFNLPKEEVTNYFIWRQKDATRNSINMLARFYFPHKVLHGKNTSEVQEMLFQSHGVNWNNISTWQKRGACIIYTHAGSIRADTQGRLQASSWIKDECIPVFTQDRDYIEQRLVSPFEENKERFTSTEVRRNLKSGEERETFAGTVTKTFKKGGPHDAEEFFKKR